MLKQCELEQYTEHRTMENKYISPFFEALNRRSEGKKEIRVESTWFEFYNYSGVRSMGLRRMAESPIITLKNPYENIRVEGIPHTHLKSLYNFDKKGRLVSEKWYSSLGGCHCDAEYYYPGKGKMALHLEKGGMEKYVLRKEVNGVIKELALTPSGKVKKETLYRLDGRFLEQTKPTGRKDERNLIAKAGYNSAGERLFFKDYTSPETTLKQEYAYDVKGRLKELLCFFRDELWDKYRYYYNQQGLCKAIFHSWPSLATTKEAVFLRYDSSGRLTDCDRLMCNGERDYKHYHYSSEGLLLSVDTRHGSREFISLKKIDSYNYK